MSFFDLPAEVRQRVYSYVFGHGDAEAFHDGVPYQSNNQHDTVVGFKPDQRSAQLFSVSRLVAREAGAVFSRQTNIVLTREFASAVNVYLSNEVDHILGPKPDDIRHLKIEIHPKDAGYIDVRDIRYMKLPNIEDISLRSFALCWADRYPSALEADTDSSYDKTVRWLRELGMLFLANTRLSLMEEKSIIGKQVVIELSSDNAEVPDARVSLG